MSNEEQLKYAKQEYSVLETFSEEQLMSYLNYREWRYTPEGRVTDGNCQGFTRCMNLKRYKDWNPSEDELNGRPLTIRAALPVKSFATRKEYLVWATRQVAQLEVETMLHRNAKNEQASAVSQ